MSDITIPIEILRVRIGLEPDDDSKDVEITAAVDTALALIETYLDRKLAYMADSQTFFSANRTILLRRWPIEPDSVVMNWPNRTDYYPISDYIDYEGGMIYAGSFGVAYPVTVAWEGGFETLPADLLWALYAAFDLVWADTPGWGGGGGSSIGGPVKRISLVGIGSVDLDTGSTGSGSGSGSVGVDTAPWGILPISVTSILDRYRRESVIGVG